MTAPLINFNMLCNSIREKAIRDIQLNLPDERLKKWQKLLVSILETELAMHRVKSALKLLKTIPPKETLETFSMSEGAWIDYQHGTWSFWISGLLDREIELVSQVGQKLIKPNNVKHKDITRPLIDSLVSQKDKVGKIRNPLAHKGIGGATEAIVSTESWKDYVILPSPVDFNDVLTPYVPYHQRWYNFLNEFSVLVVATIEQISDQLHKHIDWDKI